MRGFTLIELLIAIAIIVLITVLGISAFSRYNSGQVLKSEASRTVALLSDARARTLASKHDSRYGVHFESDRAILFQGSTYVPGDEQNEIMHLHPRATFSTALSDGGVDVIFSRISGDTDQSGSVTLRRDGGAETRTVIIDQSGIAYVEE